MPAKVAVVAVDPISVVGKRPGSKFIQFHHEAVLFEGNRLRNSTHDLFLVIAGVRLEILRMPLFFRAMRSTSGFRMYLATPTTYTGLSVAGRRPVI